MSTKNKPKNTSKDKSREPVMLSKNEALYPPDPKMLRITIIALIIAVIIAVIVFVLFPVV